MKIPCTCPCHSGVAMIHFVACCDNGYIEVPEPINSPPTTEEVKLWEEVIGHFTSWDGTVQEYIRKKMEKFKLSRRSGQKLTRSLDEQQCRDSCEHKGNRRECPFVTRKEEVLEAVEFGDWLIKNSDDRTNNDRYAADGSVKSIPDLYQEFQLFKKQKQ